MLEIIALINILTGESISKEIYFNSKNELIPNQKQEYILNNNQKTLLAGTNHLSIFSENTLKTQLLVITKPDTCNYKDIFINKLDYHQDYFELTIPDSCINYYQNIQIYIDKNIPIQKPTSNTIHIETSLVSTSESIIVQYKDQIVNTACWINGQISQAELKDFQKFNINQSECINETIDNSFFTKSQPSESFIQQQASPTNTESNTIQQPLENTTESPETTNPTPQPGELKIIEVMANSSNEYIVLQNTSNKSLGLGQTYLTDKTQTKHKLENVVLEANAIIKIETLKFQINNSNEIIYLFNKDNQLLEEFIIIDSTPETPITNSNQQVLNDQTDQLQEELNTNQQANTFETSNSDNTEADPTINTINTKQETQQEPVELPDSLKIEVGDLLITEIYANPVGTDKGQEFIEIYNNSESNIVLDQLNLQINTKTYQLSGDISPDQFVVIKQFPVTNSQTTLKLIAGETIIDQVSYASSSEGKSLIKINDSWYQTTQPSPEAENGTIEVYTGSIDVTDTTIIFNDQNLNIEGFTLELGKYENAKIEYLKTNQGDQTEIINISDLKKTTTTEESQNENQTLTSGIGLLSMASLGVLYSLFK